MSDLAPYRVQAYNTSKASENKIHDDDVARRFGFRGGLVPGVDVYGYMTHLPVMRWGRAWLERGTAECRLLKPVYDGDTATVTATEADGALELSLESRGEICATGRAALPAAPPAVALADFAAPAPLPVERPAADESSLVAGMGLAMRPFPVTPDLAAQYLSEVRETAPLYRAEGLVHPATILRPGNWVLKDNVVLGPWMHVGSTVRHLAAARVGETLTARARIAANYERKGHRFVDLDLLVLADDRPVAQIAHTAIYRPRQLAAA